MSIETLQTTRTYDNKITNENKNNKQTTTTTNGENSNKNTQGKQTTTTTNKQQQQEQMGKTTTTTNNNNIVVNKVVSTYHMFFESFWQFSAKFFWNVLAGCSLGLGQPSDLFWRQCIQHFLFGLYSDLCVVHPLHWWGETGLFSLK